MTNPENKNTQPSIEPVPLETTPQLIGATAFGLVGAAEVSAAAPLVKEAALQGKEIAVKAALGSKDLAIKTVETVKPIVKEAAVSTKEVAISGKDSAAIALFGIRKFIAKKRLSSAEQAAEDLDKDLEAVSGIAKANWINSPAIGPDHDLYPTTKRGFVVGNKVGRVKTRTFKRQAEIDRMNRVHDVEGSYKTDKEAEKRRLNAGVMYSVGTNGRPNLSTASNSYTPPRSKKEDKGYVGTAEHAIDIMTKPMLASERRALAKDYNRALRMRGQGATGRLNPFSLPKDTQRATRHFDPSEVAARTKRAEDLIDKRDERVQSLDAKKKQKLDERDKRRKATQARRKTK